MRAQTLRLFRSIVAGLGLVAIAGPAVAQDAWPGGAARRR